LIISIIYLTYLVIYLILFFNLKKLDKAMTNTELLKIIKQAAKDGVTSLDLVKEWINEIAPRNRSVDPADRPLTR